MAPNMPNALCPDPQTLKTLRSFVINGLTKVADDATGGGQESSFEQSFAALANAYLKDKAPGLLDFEIGFQLLDKNEDNSKAVGVIGFKVGPTWLYAPVFFLNGDLKGHELLYIKNQDLFVPLKENWLNYILNRRPHELGKGVNRNLTQMGVMSPNFFQLKYPPSKYASAVNAPSIAPWAAGFLPDLARAVTSNPLENYPVDLITFLKSAGEHGVHAMAQMLSTYPSLMDGIDKFYGREKISEVVREIAEAARREKSALNIKNIEKGRRFPVVRGSVMKNPLNSGSTEVNTEPGDAVKVGELQVIHYKEAKKKKSYKELAPDDGEKEKLLKGKVVIRDLRPDKKVTKVYDVEYPQKLQTPSESGIYEVLVKPHQFARCAVLMFPYNGEERKNTALIVRLEDSTWIHTHPSQVWVRSGSEERREDFEKWLKGLPTVGEGDAIRSGLNTVISPDGQQSTLPFSAFGESGNGKLQILQAHFLSRPEKYRPGSSALNLRNGAPASFTKHYQRNGEREPLMDVRRFDTNSARKPCRVVLTGKPGRRFMVNAGELYVPSGSHVLDLEQNLCGCGSDSAPPPMLDLGGMVDLHLGIIKHAGTQVTIRFDGSSYMIDNNVPLEPEDAVVDLVQVHGLREKVAREVLDATREQRVYNVFFKYAAPSYPLQQAEHSVPPVPEPYPGSDPLTGGVVPTQPELSVKTPIPTLQAQLSDRTGYDPRYADPMHPMEPDQQAANMADQAAQTGQKEVFDTAMIGGMMKNLRADSIVSKNVGGLLQANNRIGRMLAHLYWNNEAWEDRFGKEELPALEDLMRDVFESQGDLVLKLKETEVDPGPDEGVLPDVHKQLDSSY